MDDATWDSLFRNLPLIISAIIGGLVLLYKEIRGTRAINENTEITKDGVTSMNVLLEEAKEITRKQNESSEAMVKMAEERLKESDGYIARLTSPVLRPTHENDEPKDKIAS